MDLFTSGFIRINYIAKIKQTINSKDNQLINFKCNTIDADNCFKLYRSPLPDFYEMKSYGITEGPKGPGQSFNNEYYYADYGYIPGTPEFDALIDGQAFEFHDEAFCTDYKMTKKGNEWVGNNVSFHIPISASIKGETKFFKHQTQPLLIKQNETNKAILRAWISYYSNENPFKFINEKGLLKFVDCEIDKYVDNVNGYWAVYQKCTQKKSCNFTCSLMINGIEYQTEFGFEYASYEAESCYKVNTNNCYEYLPYHYNGKLEVGNPPYGLKLYMRTDKELIFKIADTKYEEGTNTLEFLASTGFYTVSPRPEACTTLLTNYNIQTSGVVIGENIESHVFVLNSLGNTVDIAVNQISQLQNYYVQLQQQLEEVKNKQNWFDIVKNVICIGGSVVNFMGGPTKLLSIAKNGISSLIGMSFAADEELIEDAVIVACDRASTVLAEVKIEELDLANEEPLLTENLNRYKYLCTSLKYDYHIEVSFAIDNLGEVVKINTYTANEDLTITNVSADQSTIDCIIIYNSPYLIIDSNYKPIKVEVKRIPKRTNTELGLGAELKDNHILSSAATVKLIENHKVHLNESFKNKLNETLNNYTSVQYVQDNYPSYTYLNANFKNNNQLANILDAYALKTELPNIPDDLVNNETLTNSLNNYALKTQLMNYELTKEIPDNNNFKIYFYFKLTKPSPNFTATITFKWVNAEGVDDSYTGVFIVENNTIVSRTGPSKKITFLGVSGSIGGRQTQYGYYNYKEGIFQWTPSIPEGGREVFNVDPERTSFTENVLYGSDLNYYSSKEEVNTLLSSYSLKEELALAIEQVKEEIAESIPSIPDDLVNNETLTTALSEYIHKKL